MTTIEWVKNPDNIGQGITVNSKTGCRNGCPYCYARKLAHTRLKQRYLANTNGATTVDFRNGEYKPDSAIYLDPFYPRWWPERLEKIRGLKKPTGIFLDDMSDWMGDYWPEEWTRQELQVMRDCPQHRFYTLTKQPQNLIKFSPFPENVFIGVTATNQDLFLAAHWLQQVEAKIKFVSFEPLLGSIKHGTHDVNIEELLCDYDISWVIGGACTGTYEGMEVLQAKYPELTLMSNPDCLNRKLWTAQPRIEWVREIVEATDKSGIKVFLKNNVKPLIQETGYRQASWAAKEWVQCKYPILRQELPGIKDSQEIRRCLIGN